MDDSDDDTPQAIELAAHGSAVPVRLLHRQPDERTGGLGGAVLAGAEHACGAWVMVMDADLQHPPEAAALIAATAMRHSVDLVIGTRYAGSGSGFEAQHGGLRGLGRRLASTGSTRLVKSVFPRRLATVSDPMSGLFVFRRDAVKLQWMRPDGFKFLLELLLRNPAARVAEVAYEFAPRHAGETKASLREGLNFLRQVSRLRRQRLIGQLRKGPESSAERGRQFGRLLAFGAVGASGVAVNTAALWVFFQVMGLNHLLGAALATQVSTTWNFGLVELLVYRGRGNGTVRGRALRFYAMNNILMLGRLPVIEVLVRSGFGVLVSNAATLVVLFLLRFALSDRVIYGAARQDSGRDPVLLLVDPAAEAGPADPAAARKRSHYLTYRYDVAGTVTIGSQIRLPELEFFRAQWIADTDGRHRGTGRRRRPPQPAPPRRDDRARRNRPGAALRGAPGPLRRQLQGRARQDHHHHRRPAAGPLPARRLHQCHRGAAALRPGRPRPDAAALRLHRTGRHRGDAVGADRHRKDRDHPAAAARAGRPLPVRRHDRGGRHRQRGVLPQAAGPSARTPCGPSTPTT
ncbi:glycosyltransferase [Streptacidiphilus sp. PAMC 29251]